MRCLPSTLLCLLSVPGIAQVAPPRSASPSSVLSVEEAREIWDTGFRQKRPTGSHPLTAAASYTPAVQKPPLTSTASKPTLAAIGFTLWRLRPPNSTDLDGARILIQDFGPKHTSTKLVPERIDVSTPLRVGDRVRLSLEVPRVGFLYVIDRERYSDGSTGDPVLIFPTLNMNGGSNEVVPGRIVEIPPQDSAVQALRITRSSDRHIGEDLIVIIAAKPLVGVNPTEGAQPLPASSVASWDHEWAANSLALNLEGAQHQVWSVAEQKAGRSPATDVLNQADPLPQTILGITSISKSQPLLIHLPLEIQ